VTSDGPRRGPYAIANDLAIAAKNAAAKAAAGRRYAAVHFISIDAQADNA